ncbi:MAG: 4-carboxymuconolactone decarboxylase, partial [Acidocella sp.]|nr:4-carboxymuconolactone decarboxylase [Acidocella sp.]
TNGHIFDAQVEVLKASFRVIRPDMRGHGLTSCTPGPYDMGLLAQDVVAVLAALGVTEFHLGGVSIGGLICQEITRSHPGRVVSLMLMATALAIPPAESWLARAETVRAEGMAAIEEGVIGRWVTPAFLGAPETAGLRAMLTRTPVMAYAACCEAIAAADFTQSTAALEIPALVMVGDGDMATPVASAQALHGALRGSALVVLEGAAHIPTVEQAGAVAEAMLGFLAPAGADDYEAGMAVRKQVLGAAHVARATEAMTALDRAFQRFITRYAWGHVWTRPGLDRRTRSLLTISMMAALGHEEELKLHLRASRNTGASPADIAEVLLQVGVYAGVPAANAAFRHAKQIFGEMEP